MVGTFIIHKKFIERVEEVEPIKLIFYIRVMGNRHRGRPTNILKDQDEWSLPLKEARDHEGLVSHIW